jgi:hypothetical protein
MTCIPWLGRCLVTLLAMTTVAMAPAMAATAVRAAGPDTSGGVGLRLLDAPTSARADPRAQIYIVDHVAPGTVIHRHIEVSNSTASPVRVVVYPAAAAIAHGSFLGAAGHTPNDLSTWTSVSPGAAAVTAGGHLTATVSITVPHDAAPGERYGVVWAEVRSAPSVGDGVIQISRVGIRVYLSVGPGGPPAANFTIDSLTALRSPDGQPTVVATVHNSGGRALDMSGSLRLSAGPGGISAGPFAATLGTTLAIGGTEPVTIVLDKQLPAGPWDARVVLRSGLISRAAQATITFPASGAALPAPTRSGRSGQGYVVRAAVLVLLAAIAAFVLWRRRRLPARQPRSPEWRRPSTISR